MQKAWDRVLAPFRPRPPLEDWTKDLLAPHDRQAIDRRTEEIQRTIDRLQREIAMIARDHRKG